MSAVYYEIIFYGWVLLFPWDSGNGFFLFNNKIFFKKQFLIINFPTPLLIEEDKTAVWISIYIVNWQWMMGNVEYQVGKTKRLTLLE